jgi:hypothetical protein
LGGAGLGTSVGTAAERTEKEKLDKMGQSVLDGAQKGIENAFVDPPEWYKEAPEWWDKGFNIKFGNNGQPIIDVNQDDVPDNIDKDYDGVPDVKDKFPDDPAKSDTTTSRLQRTLSRHNGLDSSIPGNRSVISSFRTNGLGSINSDHVTGNAYDLTGQNLGAYQQLAQDNGGFAEFHNAGGRHLHVVPGPGVPMGDTSMPVIASTEQTAAVGDASTYNFNITAGPNASPEEIARAVENIINRKTQSRKERI